MSAATKTTHTRITECLVDGSDCGHPSCPGAHDPDVCQDQHCSHPDCKTASELLLEAAESYILHDGGPGSIDYSASELFVARENMRAAIQKAKVG